MMAGRRMGMYGGAESGGEDGGGGNVVGPQ